MGVALENCSALGRSFIQSKCVSLTKDGKTRQNDSTTLYRAILINMLTLLLEKPSNFVQTVKKIRRLGSQMLKGWCNQFQTFKSNKGVSTL
jgi:CRISPR/Cas system CSM-associated protein Csm4 (group 5 of RAMP superfamily)